MRRALDHARRFSHIRVAFGILRISWSSTPPAQTPSATVVAAGNPHSIKRAASARVQSHPLTSTLRPRRSANALRSESSAKHGLASLSDAGWRSRQLYVAKDAADTETALVRQAISSPNGLSMFRAILRQRRDRTYSLPTGRGLPKKMRSTVHPMNSPA